jgi:hypothetical protein
VFTDASVDDDNFDDCADEGVVLDGPAALLRQLIEIEPALPAFKSALWRGVVDAGALNHRAESLTSLSPEPG